MVGSTVDSLPVTNYMVKEACLGLLGKNMKDSMSTITRAVLANCSFQTPQPLRELGTTESVTANLSAMIHVVAQRELNSNWMQSCGLRLFLNRLVGLSNPVTILTSNPKEVAIAAKAKFQVNDRWNQTKLDAVSHALSQLAVSALATYA